MNYLRTTSAFLLASALLAACGGDPGDTTDTTDTTGGTTSADTEATAAAPTTDPTAAPTTTDTTADPTAGSTTGGAADCELDPDLVFRRDNLVFQLQSADGATCVWLERRDDSEPDVIYKAVPYTLLEFKAGHAGALAHVTDPAELTWESTHHNWNDVATAEADGVRYRLEDWYPKDEGGEAFVVSKWALFARDAATDATLWGPVILYPYPDAN